MRSRKIKTDTRGLKSRFRALGLARQNFRYGCPEIRRTHPRRRSFLNQWSVVVGVAASAMHFREIGGGASEEALQAGGHSFGN